MRKLNSLQCAAPSFALLQQLRKALVSVSLFLRYDKVLRPLKRGEVQPGLATASPQELPMRNKLSVLLVDDHPMMLEGLRQLLSERIDGRVVMTAQDGMSALEIYKHMGDQIGVIVTDISMPKMNGPELLRKIDKMATKAVGAIILSVHSERVWFTDFYKLSGLVYPLDVISKIDAPSKILGAIKDGIELIEQRR